MSESKNIWGDHADYTTEPSRDNAMTHPVGKFISQLSFCINSKKKEWLQGILLGSCFIK